MIKSLFHFSIITMAFNVMLSCKKMVAIPEPVNSITNSETFSSDATATAAVLGIYSDLLYNTVGGNVFASSGMTIFGGISADELNNYNSGNINIQQFQLNELISNNTLINSNFWAPAYKDIYLANAVIEGLETSTGVLPETKKILTGEAKFLRAFCHFYLANLFGDVPLIISTSWSSNYLLGRAPVSQVYQQIIADLKDAQNLLSDDYLRVDNSFYSIIGAERVRVNRAAATSLLARVYLYVNRYDLAEVQATSIINNTGYYSLVSNLNNVFKANSTETIWQLQPTSVNTPYTTFEGNKLIPNTGANPDYYLTTQLLSSFESGDLRRKSWVDSVLKGTPAVTYYYPKKYKVKTGIANATPTEYYTVLRLAEIYLIRAEARAQQNNIKGAISDLNMLRARARPIPTTSMPDPLPDLADTLSQVQVLSAVAQERKIELFCEWGHRWLDLKRTNQADVLLGAFKTGWQSTDKLWPIPVTELQKDPNLSQNAGYQ